MEDKAPGKIKERTSTNMQQNGFFHVQLLFQKKIIIINNPEAIDTLLMNENEIMKI